MVINFLTFQILYVCAKGLVFFTLATNISSVNHLFGSSGLDILYDSYKDANFLYLKKSDMLKVDRVAEHQNVMYDISDADFEEIVIQYQFLENRVESEVTNVGEYIRYKEHSLNRIIKFLSSLCTIILLLDIFIMVSIINLEYKKNGICSQENIRVWNDRKESFLDYTKPSSEYYIECFVMWCGNNK